MAQIVAKYRTAMIYLRFFKGKITIFCLILIGCVDKSEIVNKSYCQFTFLEETYSSYNVYCKGYPYGVEISESANSTRGKWRLNMQEYYIIFLADFEYRSFPNSVETWYEIDPITSDLEINFVSPMYGNTYSSVGELKGSCKCR